MDQISFLKDFPVIEEERFYKKIATDLSGDYMVYSGGTYIFIRNKNGMSIRFTTRETSADTVSPVQIETWISKLHDLHPRF